MATNFRKVIINGLYLTQFVLRGVLLKALVFDKELRHKILARSIHISSRRILDALNIHVERHLAIDIEKLTDNYLIVSNHISFLDILIISSVMPVNFITSVEMKSHPLLGFMTRLGGSFYTERRSATGLPEEIATISDKLTSGFNICLFPEGTSHDGVDVKAFRSSLFESAVKSGKSIIPVCIKYTALNGEGLTKEDVKQIAWIDNQPFKENLKHILDADSIDVKVEFLRPVKNRNGGRRELCREAYSAINDCYSNFQ